MTDVETPSSAPGLALDRFLDSTLEAQSRASDWADGAYRLANFMEPGPSSIPPSFAFSPEVRDPFERLRRSELAALLPFAKLGPPPLDQIGQAAVHLLDSEDLDHIIFQTTGRRPSPRARRVVVYHGEEGARRSVLVLDPDLPAYVEPRVVPSELIADTVFNLRFETVRRALSGLDTLINRRLVAEVLAIARPRVVYAPEPDMAFVCVPQPSWRADCGPETSTVGALVRDAAGQRGVTVCHHGSGPVGTRVKLSEGPNEIESQVTLTSPVMDTCFVPISDNWRPAGLAARARVLDGRAPGAAEPHRFEGASSGPRSTRIVGADMGVPYTAPGLQLRVHTTPDLNHGDSGAALVNADDCLVGFAFQRTPYGSPAPMAFASWIWAASALDDLSLTLAET